MVGFQGRPFSALQTADFSLCPHMAEGAGELGASSIITSQRPRILIPSP